MTWENSILIKLNLEDISRQVIVDSTGILFSAEFKSFLQAKSISFKKANNLSELYSFIEDIETKILLTSLKEVPPFISAKADVKKFTINDLSLNADVKILEHLSIADLIFLLNYLNATNILQPITQSNIQQLLQTAMQYQNKIFITQLKEQIESFLQTENNYDGILELGVLLGKLQFAIYKTGNIEEQHELVLFQKRIDQYSFNFIISGNLKNIFYESAINIKSVDRIIPFLKTTSYKKIALICYDCMGIGEWELLKEYLQPLKVSFKEQPTFSLIPSITSISRNSIYYGNNTEAFHSRPINEEKELQKQFPEYICKLFREKDNITTNTLLGIDVISVIYNFFDDLAHSTKFPPQVDNKSLYFDAVKNYLSNSNVSHQIKTLVEADYKIFFCSDHGSLIARGNGKKVEKYLHDKFAKRACLIDDTSLADFLNFPQMKIPFVEDKLLVLPEERTMFNSLNTIEISHGGITVDEIVVPFIEVLK